MAQNWDIDPIKGDYVMQGGSPKQSDSLTIPAYFRIKTKRTRWLYAPDNQFGSDFYTVSKRPSTGGNDLLENIAAVALQPLLEDGRALSIQTQVTVNSRNAAGMEVSIVDASGELEVVTFKGIGL